METIGSRIHPMGSTGLDLLLEMRSFQPCASQSRGMVVCGSPEAKEQIVSPILPMESTGLRPLLDLRFLQACVTQLHGMEHYG
jgi:hypothetical protein